MATCKAVSSKGGVGGILNYVLDKEKTEEELITGIECCSLSVKEEMQATKELWGKTGGRTYKHFIISYAPDEQITPLKAHKNALGVTENTEAFKGFECLLATHTDTDHIHTHIIVNSVSFEDGHKLQWSKQDLEDLKNRVDQQCREQGLTVTEKGKHFDGSINDNVSTYSKNKHKVLEKAFTGDYKSYLLDVANAVAEARQQATSKESFIELMSEREIKTEWKDTHKNITFTTSEGKKVRNSNLEKTFKVDFGKDGLENEFQTNNLIESEKLIEWQFDGSNFGKIKNKVIKVGEAYYVPYKYGSATKTLTCVNLSRKTFKIPMENIRIVKPENYTNEMNVIVKRVKNIER